MLIVHCNKIQGNIYKQVELTGKLIVSRYVAESITNDAGYFGHVGLCQLRTKLKRTKEFCTQLTKAYVAKISCIGCY